MITPAEYFNRLPAELKKDWLPARVNNLKWPPTLRSNAWIGVLGDTPERWRLYSWQETSVNLYETLWRDDVLRTIQELTDACFNGVLNSHAQFLAKSLIKFNNIQQYVIEKNCLPASLLVANTPRGLFLVDGYHRVSWFMYTARLNKKISPVANCYLGMYDENCT